MSSKTEEGMPLTECRQCARLGSCPLPSASPDVRLCFKPIKQEVLWHEEK